MHTHTHIHIYAIIYTRMHMCVYIYIYTYTHNYTTTHTYMIGEIRDKRERETTEAVCKIHSPEQSIMHVWGQSIRTQSILKLQPYVLCQMCKVEGGMGGWSPIGNSPGWHWLPKGHQLVSNHRLVMGILSFTFPFVLTWQLRISESRFLWDSLGAWEVLPLEIKNQFESNPLKLQIRSLWIGRIHFQSSSIRGYSRLWWIAGDPLPWREWYVFRYQRHFSLVLGLCI